LTACALGIQVENCGSDFNALPDGIYPIKYSVSPHDEVYVEYNHLRTTKAMIKLRKAYCDLDLICEPDTKKAKLEKLRLIQDYLTAAKAHVEDCREATKGYNLYCEAMKLLEKYNCKNCK
jgi:hypothetical protein